MSTTEGIIPVPTQEALQYLDNEVQRCLTSSLTSMLGGGAVSAEREMSTYPSDAVWFDGGFTGGAAGSILFGLEPSEAVAMGHKLLAEAGLEGESDETSLETLGEVLAQTAGGLASSFVARLKKDVSAETLAKTAAPTNADHILPYRLIASDGSVLRLWAVLEPNLVTTLTIQPPEPVAKNAAAIPAPPLPPTPAISGPNTRNLELLLDVELPVSVSFGRAQLQLKDVIKLTTGSIVELNRSVSEPVDIVVNNCVIARGEVVVIEGNFGVRIKQIVSKEDRLRSLG